MTDDGTVRVTMFTWEGCVAGSSAAPSVKLVAHTLALHMAKEGDSCFPSVPTIARKASLSERHVQRCLRLLEKGHWLEVTERPGRSSLYYATLPPGHPAAPSGGVTPVSPQGRRPGHPGGDTRVRGGVTRASPVPDQVPDQAPDQRAARGANLGTEAGLDGAPANVAQLALGESGCAHVSCTGPTCEYDLADAAPPPTELFGRCPKCGIGGGRHVEGCENATPAATADSGQR